MRRTYQTPEKPTSAQFKFQIPHFKILNAKQDAPSAGARILMMGDGDGRNVLNVMVLRHKSLIILRGGLAGGLACLYTTPTPRGLFSYLLELLAIVACLLERLRQHPQTYCRSSYIQSFRRRVRPEHKHG
jgi:hypothetical protein